VLRPHGVDGLKKQLNKAFEKQYKAAYNLASKAVRALERAAKQGQMATAKAKPAAGAGGSGGKKGKRASAAGKLLPMACDAWSLNASRATSTFVVPLL
jgi:hypothetical protein